jgi:hypothetical protein
MNEISEGASIWACLHASNNAVDGEVHAVALC